MKLPKTLIHSILVGVTALSMGACTQDLVKITCEDVTCEHKEDCRANTNPQKDPCPACGMG